MHIRHLVSSIAVGAAVIAFAAGCSAHANLTVSSGQLEKAVANALEKSVGQRPAVDCGDKTVDLVDGTTTHCDISTPGQSVKYDSTVKISDVHGSKYEVNVEVAKTPEN